MCRSGTTRHISRLAHSAPASSSQSLTIEGPPPTQPRPSGRGASSKQDTLLVPQEVRCACSQVSTSLPLGKLLGQPLVATGVSGLTHSSLLHVSDRNSNCKFLVDTGSEVSVIPPTPADRRRPPDPLTLSAVNNTAIPTYLGFSSSLTSRSQSLVRIFYVTLD